MLNFRSIHWDGAENDLYKGRQISNDFEDFGFSGFSGFRALWWHRLGGFWALALRCRAILRLNMICKWLVELE